MENWYIGGLYGNQAYLIALKQFLDNVLPNQFHISIFDSHPFLPWNGGNVESNYTIEKKEQFTNSVKILNHFGISVYMVFSNLLLEEADLFDKRCNYILRECYNSINGVIVGSNVLAKYIRDKFPNYTLVHSLTHANYDLNYYEQNKHLYAKFVLPPKFLFNDKLLSDVMEIIDKHNIEITLNDTCYRNCPYEKEHYLTNSLAVKNNNWNIWENDVIGFCEKHNKDRLIKCKNILDIQSVRLDVGMLQDFRNKGIKNFKLSTRGCPVNEVIKEVEYYLLDPLNIRTPFHVFKKYFFKLGKTGEII